MSRLCASDSFMSFSYSFVFFLHRFRTRVTFLPSDCSTCFILTENAMGASFGLLLEYMNCNNTSSSLLQYSRFFV